LQLCCCGPFKPSFCFWNNWSQKLFEWPGSQSSVLDHGKVDTCLSVGGNAVPLSSRSASPPALLAALALEQFAEHSPPLVLQWLGRTPSLGMLISGSDLHALAGTPQRKPCMADARWKSCATTELPCTAWLAKLWHQSALPQDLLWIITSLLRSVYLVEQSQPWAPHLRPSGGHKKGLAQRCGWFQTTWNQRGPSHFNTQQSPKIN
jgi:hypothetical protein